MVRSPCDYPDGTVKYFTASRYEFICRRGNGEREGYFDGHDILGGIAVLSYDVIIYGNHGSLSTNLIVPDQSHVRTRFLRVGDCNGY